MALTAIVLLVLALYMVQIVLQETSCFGFNLRGIDRSRTRRGTKGRKMRNRKPDTVLNPENIRRYYDWLGKTLDSQGFYENPALTDLREHFELQKAKSVIEFGCGTGRFAAELLEDELPPGAHYLGIDISGVMVELAQARLQRFGDRANIMQSNGALHVNARDAGTERFVLTYVLDLLSQNDAKALFGEAHRLLRPGGLLGISSLAPGTALPANLVSTIWTALFRLSPAITGGCRPINAIALLDTAQWEIRHHQRLAPFGVCSEVIVASKRL